MKLKRMISPSSSPSSNPSSFSFLWNFLEEGGAGAGGEEEEIEYGERTLSHLHEWISHLNPTISCLIMVFVISLLVILWILFHPRHRHLHED
jgi:hypothetical protein